jgi:molecular chaperone DnaK
LIERNTTIPAKKSQVFSTAADGQTSVTINVFQGERELAVDNKSLGRFDLTGISSAARGVPQIEVTFDIDANGIVSVQAKDKASGKEQQIRIEASGGLSDIEIKAMVKEAEANAGSDKKRRAFIESKNHADATIEKLEKSLKEHEQMLKTPDKAAAEAAISSVRAAMSGSDNEKLKEAVEHLNQAAIAIESAAQKAPGAKVGAQSAQDEKVLDAEFEEVGSDKN